VSGCGSLRPLERCCWCSTLARRCSRRFVVVAISSVWVGPPNRSQALVSGVIQRSTSTQAVPAQRGHGGHQINWRCAASTRFAGRDNYFCRRRASKGVLPTTRRASVATGRVVARSEGDSARAPTGAEAPTEASRTSRLTVHGPLVGTPISEVRPSSLRPGCDALPAPCGSWGRRTRGRRRGARGGR
jgi:hypothetical protein